MHCATGAALLVFTGLLPFLFYCAFSFMQQTLRRLAEEPASATHLNIAPRTRARAPPTVWRPLVLRQSLHTVD